VDERQAGLQRRTLAVVVVSQVFGGAGLAAGVTVGALLAEDMLGGTSMSGLPAGLFTLGSALAAYLVGRLSQRSGRRTGLAAGFLTGAAGAVDEQGREQQHRVVEHGGHGHAQCTEGSGDEAGSQAVAAPGCLGETPDAEGGQRGPEREQRHRQAGECLPAQHVLGKQGAHSDPGGEPGAAEHLADDDHGQAATLHRPSSSLVEQGRRTRARGGAHVVPDLQFLSG